VNSVVQTLLHLIFPQLCMHCEEETHSSVRLFCDPCISALVLEQTNTRCPFCFSSSQGICLECKDKPQDRAIAAFSNIGPAKSLIQELQYRGRYKVAKDAAALMSAQYLKEGLSFPDCLIPIPENKLKSLGRGYEVNYLLAQQVGKILGACVIHPYKPSDIANKNILLIGDVLDHKRGYLEQVIALKRLSCKSITSLFFAVNF
jgi:predicted amidophosphoribosyltransferase